MTVRNGNRIQTELEPSYDKELN